MVCLSSLHFYDDSRTPDYEQQLLVTTTVFHSVILSSKNHVSDHVNTNASSKINNHNFHLGVFFLGGGGALKGNRGGAGGMAALFKESLCICAASC